MWIYNGKLKLILSESQGRLCKVSFAEPDVWGDEKQLEFSPLMAVVCRQLDEYFAGARKEFDIPLKYKNLTEKPAYIIIVCSASKYGDYFTGGHGSTMYLDDFELVYDGTPTIWE